MNFLSYNSRGSRRASFIKVVLAIAILSIFFKFQLFPELFSRGVAYLAAPLWRTENYLAQKINEYSALVSTKKDLVKENDSLQKRIIRLRVELLEKNLLSSENRGLKEILGRHEGTENARATLLSAVLSKPNRSPYDTLVLDAGREHGITVGNEVIAYGNIVIGKIDTVSKQTSRAKLFSSPGEEINVVIGEENISAIALGIGGGNFEIRLPRGIDVREGDTISFPSIRTKIVGVIEKIKVKPTDSLQTILFKSPINLYQLRWVEILAD